MHRLPLAALPLALFACVSASSEREQPLSAEEVAPVAENYADLVARNYADAHAAALELRDAIASFVADPSETKLTVARKAWLDAREPYGQSEAFRFYDGPIDAIEGRLNAWPMDEAYVDYVEGMPEAGIINDPDSYARIDQDLLIELNERGGETNIAAGYHAIEFLLWGQDLSAEGPGARPWTDYSQSEAATANNQDRRASYLLAAADLLVADLASLTLAWAADSESSYRQQFVSEAPEEIVRRMLLGMGTLSGEELAGERIEVALATRDQEDEHSCFSDNTHRDIVTDALGIQNVYLGSYGGEQGPGLYELVAARDQALADRLAEQLQASVDAALAIPAPFDRAIVEHREAVEATVAALRAQADTIVEVAALLEIPLELE
jgi:putative iron-regulated protein